MSLPPAELTFTDGSLLPLGSIYCIGRNYRDHAAEMKAEMPSEPLVFLKPSSALVHTGGLVDIPPFSQSMHYEGELVVAIGKEALNVSPEAAPQYLAGVGVGIDFTLRDVQEQAKIKGEPWTRAKGFRGSGPISPLVKLTDSVSIEALEFSLRLNGTERQHGAAALMERSVPTLISYLSKVFGLRAGDVVFTGTPKGVGPVAYGDSLSAELLSASGEKLTRLEVQISKPACCL